MKHSNAYKPYQDALIKASWFDVVVVAVVAVLA